MGTKVNTDGAPKKTRHPNSLANLKPAWKKGDPSPNPKGSPKGTKRSTIAKKWLGAMQAIENPITKEMEILTQEDIITLGLIKKARGGDARAYKALMDSAYGLQTREHEIKLAPGTIEYEDAEIEDLTIYIPKKK